MRKVNVVLFSGGRGSQVLSRQLVKTPQVRLTLAINGYDDGLSTGEVRRFLQDSLGPSDFRKNASTMARELHSCDQALVELLDLRFPVDYTETRALRSLHLAPGNRREPDQGFDKKLENLLDDVNPTTRAAVISRLGNFNDERNSTGFKFDFADCSIGNLVFAGCYLEVHRDFNLAIADYCSLMNVPEGLVINVTDGTNAFLVAVNRENHLLASEADIVDGERRNYIDEIYLIDAPPAEWIDNIDTHKDLRTELESRSIPVPPNPELLTRIARADVIVYSPGTQHSSLLPSYMTPTLGSAIAKNQSAVKVLVTNIQEDAEIPDISAVEIIDKALYYLRERNTEQIPTPFLITHYLLNDSTRVDKSTPYVPLGKLQNVEDPRLVRIANFEDGLTGRHNAEKVLMPFIESFVEKEKRSTIAIILLDTESLDKISQSILEATRAGLEDIKANITFYYECEKSLDKVIADTLPFRLCNTRKADTGGTNNLLQATLADNPGFVILFESSGMYRGEDIVNLASLLTGNRLDAVWGSRRLSVRDIRESYHLRYKRNPVLGFASYLGSYLLSLTFLFLYGHYMSDSLSGARAVRTRYLRDPSVCLEDKRLNYNILSRILRDQGDIFETPVSFFSLSPEKANRTTITDGLRGIVEIFKWRIFH